MNKPNKNWADTSFFKTGLLQPKKALIRGLLFVVPFLVLLWVVRLFWRIGAGFSEDILLLVGVSPDSLPWIIKLLLPLLTLLLMLVFFWSVGSLLATGRFKFLLELPSRVIKRFPLVSTVFKTVEQMVETFKTSDSGSNAKEVVWAQYPLEGSWALAFVTRSFPKHRLSLVYIPTAPNPTSGFNLLMESHLLRRSGLTYEEAIKLVLSLGLVTPANLESNDPLFIELEKSPKQ